VPQSIRKVVEPRVRVIRAILEESFASVEVDVVGSTAHA
jgi:hypothetical protein